MLGVRPRWVLNGGVAALLIALALLVFADVRHHAYLPLDDDLYIVENPLLEEGLTGANVARVFSPGYADNWIPITWVSYLVDAELWDAAPGAVLFTNVILHALSAALLFLFLARATGAIAPSAFAAAVFAVHPLHVESVAWASERKDVLCALFWFATLHAYAAWVHKPSMLRYLAVALGLCLALLSKPMAVTLPLVLVLMDVWPLSRSGSRPDFASLPRVLGRSLLEKVPLLALAAAAAALTFAVQAEFGAMQAAQSVPLGLRVQNALAAYVAYLGKTLWPVDLAFFYPYPFEGMDTWRWMGALALLLALSVIAVRELPRRPFLAVGWLWYLGTLVPVIGIVQIGMQSMADRYTYLPLVGIGIAVAWGGAELAARSRRAGWTAGPTALAAIAVLSVLCMQQVERWRDGEALFAHTLHVTGENPTARGGLALAVLRDGRVDEAVEHFATAFGLRVRGEPARRAVRDALMATGAAQLREGRPAQAALYYRAAIAIEPGLASLRVGLGTALSLQGRHALAVTSFDEALAIAPRSAVILARSATVLERAGRSEEALARHRAAAALEPESPVWARRLARALVARPDVSGAEREEALRVAHSDVYMGGSENAEGLDARASVYALLGRYEDAEHSARRAVDLARLRGRTALADEIEIRRREYASRTAQ